MTHQRTSVATQETIGLLRRSLATTSHIAGYTHNFYLYPGRFHPEIARDVIRSFTAVGDWIIDPFMGGGTSVIEAIGLGRRAVGSDVNALAHFVTDVRTRTALVRG